LEVVEGVVAASQSSEVQTLIGLQKASVRVAPVGQMSQIAVIIEATAVVGAEAGVASAIEIENKIGAAPTNTSDEVEGEIQEHAHIAAIREQVEGATIAVIGAPAAVAAEKEAETNAEITVLDRGPGLGTETIQDPGPEREVEIKIEVEGVDREAEKSGIAATAVVAVAVAITVAAEERRERTREKRGRRKRKTNTMTRSSSKTQRNNLCPNSTFLLSR
jgi:hypothetical protein